MGYQTALHLIDVKIKDDSLPFVKRALQTKKERGLRPLVYFLEEVFVPRRRLPVFQGYRKIRQSIHF